jgi:hypothetical protein
MTMIISGSDGLEFPDGSDQGTAFTGNAATITSGTIATARLATGTANSSTYLRGDQTWAAVPAATPGGSTTQVQFNNAGAFGGNSGFVYSSGNVGIGTSSPTAISTYTTLDIRGSTGGGLRFGNATDAGYLYSDSTSTQIASATSKPLQFATNGTEQMRIDSSGNVMVGRTTVTGTNCRLNVQLSGTTASGYTAATNAGVSLDCGTATNGVVNLVGGGELGVYRSNSSGAYDVGIGFGTNAARILRFDTAATQRMNIDSSGNIYVGADTTCNLTDFRSKSLSANGYQRIAGGLIIQWGSFAFGASATGTVTLPLTFPSSFASASYTTNFGGGQNTFNWTIGLYPTSTSTFAWTNASSSAGGTAYWIAIGY